MPEESEGSAFAFGQSPYDVVHNGRRYSASEGRLPESRNGPVSEKLRAILLRRFDLVVREPGRLGPVDAGMCWGETPLGKTVVRHPSKLKTILQVEAITSKSAQEGCYPNGYVSEEVIHPLATANGGLS